MITFYRRVIGDFGWHFTLVLFSVYLLLKGTVAQLIQTSLLPYFKSLNISGNKYQSFIIVTNIPWSLKAFMGVLSDAVPLAGFHKISYIIIASIMGVAALAVLGFVQLTPATAALGACLCLLTQFQVAFVDLLTEGKYAEMMAANPASGTDLVCFAWGLLNVGKFLGSTVGGPIADHFNPRYIFLVCLPLAAQVLIPPALGWYPDPRLPPERRGIRHDKVREHPNLFKLSVAVSVSAIALSVAALLASDRTQFSVAVLTTVFLCVLGAMWFPPTIRRCSLYMFLTNLLYISINGATDYWFTADNKCVPGGPNFSFTFFNTIAAVVGSLAGGLGVVLFQRFLSRGTFRKAFYVTCMVKVIGSFSDIIIVKRLNLRVGIPDWVAFICGDAVIQQLSIMLDLMPAVILTSKACPKGMEASVYALLAAYQNIGAAAARGLGLGLIEFFGIKTTEPCEFTQLPMVIFIAHVAFPLLAFPLVFVLIPDAKMTDESIGGPTLGDGGEAFQAVPADEKDDDLDGKKNVHDKSKEDDTVIPPEVEPLAPSDEDAGIIEPEVSQETEASPG